MWFIVDLIVGLICIIEIPIYNLTLGSKVRHVLDIQDDVNLRDRLHGILAILLARDIIETILMIIIIAVSKTRIGANFCMAIIDYSFVLFFRAEIISMIKNYNEEAITGTKLEPSDPIMITYWVLFAAVWLAKLITVTKIIYCKPKEEPKPDQEIEISI